MAWSQSFVLLALAMPHTEVEPLQTLHQGTIVSELHKRTYENMLQNKRMKIEHKF